MWLLYALSAVVLYFLGAALWRRWRYDLHKIPSPAELPFLGHARHFQDGKTLYTLFRQWNTELGYPKAIRIRLKGEDIVYVMDATCAKTDIFPKGANLPKSPHVGSDFIQMLSGDPRYKSCFVTSETTPYVKLLRKAMAKCMTPIALKQAIPRLVKVSKAMNEVIDRDLQKGPINLEDLFTRTTLDIIGEVAFEADLGGLNKKKPIYELIGTCGYFVRSFNLRPLMKLRYVMFPNSAWSKNIRAKFKQIVGLWHEVAMEIRRRPQIPDGGTTIWSVLKDLKMPGTDDLLPIELLRGEVAFVVIGGMDSTGHVLAWMCSLLATYPHVQDKIIDELKGRGLYGKDAREVEYEDIGELQYLTAALKEALRLVQVIALSVRRYANKDTTLCGYRIPKGTHVMVGGCNTKIQDPDWEEPDAFKPERWLTGEDLSQKLYFPFGAGDRDCIAQRLAMIAMRFVLVKFISTYSFHLKKGETFESLYTNQCHGVAVKSAEGINVEIRRRF